MEDKGCRVQFQKPVANYFLSHCSQQTANCSNLTFRPATSSKRNGRELVISLAYGVKASLSLNLSFSVSLSNHLPISNFSVVKPKPLTTPTFLNSDDAIFHYFQRSHVAFLLLIPHRFSCPATHTHTSPLRYFRVRTP